MERPTSITVLGILNIGFAALGLVGLIATIIMFYTPADTNNPVIKIMHENQAYATWMKICIPLGFISSSVLLAAGIGLLHLKSWARTLSIAYAIYAFVFAIVGAVLNFIFITQPLLEQARHQHGPEAAGAIGGAMGGSIGGCYGLIYPVVLLIFMFRPTVVAALRRSAPPQAQT